MDHVQEEPNASFQKPIANGKLKVLQFRSFVAHVYEA
jgi:hypothetical protein